MQPAAEAGLRGPLVRPAALMRLRRKLGEALFCFLDLS
jgi:hypothetical protein